MAVANGADHLVIRPLSDFKAGDLKLPAGYPQAGLFKNFS